MSRYCHLQTFETKPTREEEHAMQMNGREVLFCVYSQTIEVGIVILKISLSQRRESFQWRRRDRLFCLYAFIITPLQPLTIPCPKGLTNLYLSPSRWFLCIVQENTYKLSPQKFKDKYTSMTQSQLK